MPPSYGVGDPERGFAPMDWERVRRRLESERNYWIATASADATPAASPVWGVWTDDDSFHFFTDPDSLKARNLERNPRAVVHAESGDDAIILEGTMERVQPSAEVVRAYEEKYGVSPPSDAPDAAAYRLRPVKALAWLESDFPKTATRWRFG